MFNKVLKCQILLVTNNIDDFVKLAEALNNLDVNFNLQVMFSSETPKHFTAIAKGFEGAFDLGKGFTEKLRLQKQVDRLKRDIDLNSGSLENLITVKNDLVVEIDNLKIERRKIEEAGESENADTS